MEDLDVDGMDVKLIERLWTGLIWLSIGRSGRLVCIFGFHKILGNFD
jgi:hypothetical protein